MYSDCCEDLIFVDDKLPAKTAKITSLENLYVYGITSIHIKVTLSYYPDKPSI